ncbi:hypothetical protein V0R52_28635, partial [Pseudomonas asiatica]|uniref:hypothetical protein n=1 Tax=Pseudomonas asiatica TaxID=2219225 RepID=UPI002E7C0590
MELNAQRAGWVQALQEWRAQPQRHFEYFTSQALLGIRELHAAMAAVQGAEDAQREAQQVEQWNDSPIAAKAYLPPVDIDAQAERNTALDRYRQGIVDSDPGTLARFVEVDLNTARNDPASLGIAMTDSFRFGLEQVLEFSTFSSARFTSAHGFYSRLGRWHETRTHVRNVIQQEQLPNGLLALTLPDPVGMV